MSFCDWLISLVFKVYSRWHGWVLHFYGWIISIITAIIYISHFVYPVMSCFYLLLLWLMLQWTLAYKYTCPSFGSFRYRPGNGIAGCILQQFCFHFSGAAKLFSIVCVPFTFPPAMCQGYNFSTSSTIIFFIIVILVGIITWHLLLICNP